MASASTFPATLHIWAAIPVDLTVFKNPLTRDFRVRDANGNLIFTVNCLFLAPGDKRVLLDSAGNPLITIYQKGGWQCFRGDSLEQKDLIFRVEILSISRLRTELKVLLEAGASAGLGQMYHELRVKGNPFNRSCTIYGGNSIIAQTSPRYKLGKAVVGRFKFWLTIYPGIEHALVVAIIVIFFIG